MEQENNPIIKPMFQKHLIKLKWVMLVWLLGLLMLECQKQPNKLNEGYALSSDHIIIHYLSNSHGSPALIFIHGWCANANFWKYQTLYFANKYQVVAIDLAGHGKSGSNRKDWTIETLGRDVKTVIEKLKINDFILIGNQLGALVALETAQLLPKKTIGIVGVDAFQNLEDRFSPQQREYLITKYRKNFSEEIASSIKTMFSDSADSNLVEETSKAMLAISPDVAIPLLDEMLKYNSIKTLRRLSIPIKCINSTRYPTNLYIANLYIASFERVEIKDVGMFMMLEKPSLFNSILEEMIQRF